jgi:hypothetical protein
VVERGKARKRERWANFERLKERPAQNNGVAVRFWSTTTHSELPLLLDFYTFYATRPSSQLPVISMETLVALPTESVDNLVDNYYTGLHKHLPLHAFYYFEQSITSLLKTP